MLKTELLIDEISFIHISQIKLKYFLEYSNSNFDDSPMCLSEDFVGFSESAADAALDRERTPEERENAMKAVRQTMSDIDNGVRYDHEDQYYDGCAALLTDDVLIALHKDYKPPKYFRENFLTLIGTEGPPHRSFIVGPRRSGEPTFFFSRSSVLIIINMAINLLYAGVFMHVDPYGVSSWNTAVRGKSRWILFPPGTPAPVSNYFFLCLVI